MTVRVWCLGVVLLYGNAATAQQAVDTTFSWRPPTPRYAAGEGPVVCVDEAHHNVHTASGAYRPFVQLALADGYVVQALTSTSSEALGRCALVLIVSPRHAATLQSRRRPIREALDAVEIDELHRWVMAGGRLLLVADHMPIAGSMLRLAARFDVELLDVFVADSADATAREPIVLRRADGTLADHAVTNGRAPGDRVDSVAIFTGSALARPRGAGVIARYPPDTKVIAPDAPWEFDGARTSPGAGLGIGYVAVRGRGRLAVFTEAALFTAQWDAVTGHPMGMNHPSAGQNPRFVLNLLQWLVGR